MLRELIRRLRFGNATCIACRCGSRSYRPYRTHETCYLPKGHPGAHRWAR